MQSVTGNTSLSLRPLIPLPALRSCPDICPCFWNVFPLFLLVQIYFLHQFLIKKRKPQPVPPSAYIPLRRTFWSQVNHHFLWDKTPDFLVCHARPFMLWCSTFLPSARTAATVAAATVPGYPLSQLLAEASRRVRDTTELCYLL